MAQPTLQDISDKLDQVLLTLGSISVKQGQPIVVEKKVVVQGSGVNPKTKK
jgi:hypothetical protein